MRSDLQEPAYGYYPSGMHLEKGLQFQDLLRLLWRSKWIVLAALAFTVGLVTAYIVIVPPEYEAYSLLLVKTDQAQVTQGLDVEIEDALGLNDRKLANEVLILRQSHDIANGVAEQVKQIKTVPGTPTPLTMLYDDDHQELSREAIAARLTENYVQIRPEGEAVDAVRIIASSTDPMEAALIANLYSEEYLKRAVETSRMRISASRSFLEEQEGKLREGLEGLENQIKTFMSREGAADLDEEASQTVTQVAQLQSMLDQTRIDREMKEASLQTLEQDLADIEPKLVQRVASGAEQELAKVHESIADFELRLEQIYQLNPSLRDNLSSHVEVAEYNRRIRELRQRAQGLSQQYVDEALSTGVADPIGEGNGLAYVAQQRRNLAESRIEISGLRAKEEVLQRRLREYEAKLRELPTQAIELAQLQRARASTESLYLFLVQKLHDVRIAEESEIGYAEVIRPAFVPEAPVRPNVMRSLMLAVLLGLMLGSGLVLAHHRLDHRVHQPDDLRELGQNVIGVIPAMKPEGQETKEDEFTVVDGRRLNTKLAMLLNPVSPAAEAYRRLRTNIQFSRPDVVVKTILVTSPDAGEGKSTTVVNLAIAMAQASRRTIIVDADLRRPRQHVLLELNRNPGLSDILFDPSAFDPEAYYTGVEDLYLIPAGREVPASTELLGSRKMREFIDLLRDSFDVVLFDSPPVGLFSEAMLLSTQCEATLLVAEAGKSDHKAFEHAVGVLQGVGAELIGAVLNKYDPKSGLGGYGYGYGYGYEAYYTEDGSKKQKRGKIAL